MKTDPKAEAAFKQHEAIKQNEKIRRALLAQNAEILSSLFTSGDYKSIVGDPDAEWSAYLAQVDVYYSRNEVDSYIKVYTKLTKELGIPKEVWIDIPITRLTDCLRLITASNWEDWFATALTLTTRDWTLHVRESKGLTTEETVGHVHDNKLYEICKQCGKKAPFHEHTDSAITDHS